MSSLRRASWGETWERNAASSIWFCAGSWLLLQAGGPGASMPSYETQELLQKLSLGPATPSGLSGTGGMFLATTMCAGKGEGSPSATSCSFGRALPAELLARLTRQGMSILRGDAETEPKTTPREVFSLLQGRAKDKAIFAGSLCSCLMLLSLYS